MFFTEFIAAALYLLPATIWACACAQRSTPEAREGTFAVQLATGIAVDLLVVLLLARAVRLETATLLARAAWVLGGSAIGLRAWRAGWRPTAPSRAALVRVAGPLLVAVGAALFSASLSRACAMWDREWHIPLVSALRGQRLPFQNVYLPAQGLFYHYAGDVQAAMLQTLSGARLHASLALSLLHDLMFALIALNLVCFLRAAGVRRTTPAAIVFVALVLLGPVTLLRDNVERVGSGFALVNMLTLSFRPHVALSVLLQLGLLEQALAPLLPGAALPATSCAERTAGFALLAAALVLADETSLGVVGVGLGALWLVDPSVFGPTRAKGAIVLGALLGASLLSVIVFGGSLGPSAPKYAISLVAPRAPAYAGPALPLASAAGRSLFVQDLLPVLAALVALVALTLRRRDRRNIGLTAFYAALLLTVVVALACFDFEGKPSENHRFATAAFVAAPLVLALAFVGQFGAPGVELGGSAALVAFVGLGLGVASTVEWFGGGVALRQCEHPAFSGFAADRFYDVDCRRETDAALGEQTTPTYVDANGFYLWSGCHPVFAAAPVGGSGHKIRTTTPWFGRPALEGLRSAVEPDGHVAFVCLSAPGTSPGDARACAAVDGPRVCAPRGGRFRACAVAASELASLGRAM